MSEKVGIKELSELVVFVARTANAVDGALEDNEISLGDTVRLYEPLKAAGPAFENIKAVVPELDDLSPAESAELTALVAKELDLHNDAAEKLVEDIFGTVSSLAAVILGLRKARTA